MKKISLFALLTLNMLFAVTLVPLTETMDSKKQKNTIFKINNPTGEPVAVDFSVLKLTDTDNNKEQREISQNVSYYPSQFVLMPNETKNVRVKYIGTDLPAIEEVYRVIAKELDVDVSEKNSTAPKGKISASIKMRFSYEGLLFVKRADAKPILAIESFENFQKVGYLSSSQIVEMRVMCQISHFITFLQKSMVKSICFKRKILPMLNLDGFYQIRKILSF